MTPRNHGTRACARGRPGVHGRAQPQVPGGRQPAARRRGLGLARDLVPRAEGGECRAAGAACSDRAEGARGGSQGIPPVRSGVGHRRRQGDPRLQGGRRAPRGVPRRARRPSSRVGAVLQLRYQAHMLWDVTLPAVLGYLAAILYNQNNVAAEASPVATEFEMEVGRDLCAMLGYTVPPVDQKPSNSSSVVPWGHITCDGSVANIESMSAARNLKYFPVALAAALGNDVRLAAAKGLTTTRPDGQSARLVDLDAWGQLNLGVDEILAFPTRISTEFKINTATLATVLGGYSIQNLGFTELCRRFLPDVSDGVVFGAGTASLLLAEGRCLARRRFGEPRLDSRRPRGAHGRRRASCAARPLPGREAPRAPGRGGHGIDRGGRRRSARGDPRRPRRVPAIRDGLPDPRGRRVGRILRVDPAACATGRGSRPRGRSGTFAGTRPR